VEATISSLPLRDIAQQALGTLQALNALLRSPEVHQSIASLASSMARADTLLADARPRLDETLLRADATLDAGQTMANHATGTIDALTPDLKDAMQHLAQLVGNAEHQVGPLVADLFGVAKSLDMLLAQAQADLFTGVGLLAPRSPLQQDAETTMRDLASACGSLP
jgi:hypothetical protein